jgi:hypothetical protein
VSLRIRSQDLGARLLADAVERLEREPDWRGAPQPPGDWPTYTSPTLAELDGYRRRLRELWRRADEASQGPDAVRDGNDAAATPPTRGSR